ncbi:MAG: HEAT repeat domain-containing protein [Anaerolineae bacterium]|nr:HEAT repeat domain-containing protein [Anaerolineae bacterium]
MSTPVPNIWQMQSQGDIEGLIAALQYPEAGVRKDAAAALRAIGAWQAVPALKVALAVEQDWQAHAALAAALQYLDHDIHIETMIKHRDVDGLLKMLNSSNVDDVMQACDALATLDDRRATEPLVMVFRNPLLPNKARLAAAEALLKLASAPAVVTLLGALRRDEWQVRRNAAAVLGQLQATWATEPLIKTLDDANQVVRRTALAALHRIGTPEALAAIKAFEESPHKRETQEVAPAEPASVHVDLQTVHYPLPTPITKGQAPRSVIGKLLNKLSTQPMQPPPVDADSSTSTQPANPLPEAPRIPDQPKAES